MAWMCADVQVCVDDDAGRPGARSITCVEDQLALSQRYLITPLQAALERWVIDRALSPATAVTWLVYAQSHGYTRVQEAAMRYVCRHWAKVKAEADQLAKLKQHPDLMLDIMDKQAALAEGKRRGGGGARDDEEDGGHGEDDSEDVDEDDDDEEDRYNRERARARGRAEANKRRRL